MRIALWALWFFYCLGLLPTWAFVYLRLRDGHRGVLRSWAVASGCALVWLPFLIQHFRWERRQARRSWVDVLEDELHSLPRS